MAKQTPPATPKISASADDAPKPQNPESKAAQPSAMEVNAPLISSEVHGIVVPSAMKGSYLTVDPRMDGSDITVTFSAKEAPELVLENLVDSSGETGARKIEIPLSYLTRLMGFTALFSYTGRSQGQLAASLVKEVGISFYPASESEALAPRLLHEKILHNTPTYDMKDHEGNETVIVPLHPLAKAGDKVYCTAVTEQDVPPHEFYTVIYDHRLTEEEVASGDALRPEIARGWLSRRKPWRSITLQSAWITSGLPAEPPADIDPHLETRLPRNALEVQRRRTAALIVAPGLDLPPPHLRQSVQYNDEWCLNPENTREGGEVIIPGLDAYKGDEVKFYVSGPGYAKKLLGHVTLEQDGDLPCIKLSACVVACFFTQAMTLSYTLGFNDNEQSSPVRVINVLTPTFPPAQIEEATKTILSLTTFKGDATARVPVPAYSVCSSYCWMWFVGKYEDGRAYRFDILERATMTDAWKAQGVLAPIPRAALQELADCSTFELHFALSFCEKDTFESAHAFPVQTFTIEQEPLELLAPTVTEAVGNELTVWNGRDGVHVEASYLGNHPTHTLSLCWTQPNGTCWPLESQPGSASGTTTFLVPREAVIESIGKTVKINYTVTSACKVQTSKDLNLHISVPVRLPTPVVEQATPRATQNGILDLRTFNGDADITVEPWWFILLGQVGWLECAGIADADGAAYTIKVATAEPISQSEVSGGLAKILKRAELEKLRNQTDLVVALKATPDVGGGVSNAIEFPPLTLLFKKAIALPVPHVPEADSGVLDFLQLCCEKAHLVVGPWTNIATDNRISLSCTGNAVGGGAHSVVLLPERAVTPSEVLNGLNIDVANAQLASFANGTEIILQLNMRFPNESLQPFDPVALKLIKSRQIVERFDGQPNKLLKPGESISLSTMTITMVQLAPNGKGGIYTYGTVGEFMSGPAFGFCIDFSGFLTPAQITRFTFTVPCACLRFAYAHLDGQAIVRFYAESGAIIETRIVASTNGGRHQWVQFKAGKGELLASVEVEVGDHGYLDNFTMCSPVDA